MAGQNVGVHDRAVIIAPERIRAMTADAARYFVSHRPGVVLWVMPALIVAALIAVLIALDVRDPVALGALTVAALVSPAVVPFAARRSLRSVVADGYPVGSTVTAELRPDSLHIASATSVADLGYSTFRGVHLVRDTAVLVYRSRQAMVFLPREVFTDDDLARLRDRIRGEQARVDP